MNNENSHLIFNDKVIDLMLAGNFTFTAKSLKTGNHYTYRIQKNIINAYEVYYLINGNEDYRWLGTLLLNDGIFKFKGGASIKINTPVYIAFHSITNTAVFRQLHPLLEIWHQGKCARCGRLLTHPDSILLGVGPECIKKNEKYIKSLNLL